MFQRALLIFENQQVLPQAVAYARELARRMDCEVSLLMLVEMSFKDSALLGSKRHRVSDLEERAGVVLRELVAGLIAQGVTISAAVRVGDPAQELLKFLAERPPFHVLVWGSGPVLPEAGRGGRGHWLAKVAASLECPLLSVQSKSASPDPAGQALSLANRTRD